MADHRVLNAQPWRFIPGDTVHVCGWHETALVTQQVPLRFPHYLVADADGAEWRVSQLQMSSKPIIER
jgi:hypothetical protein